MMNLVDIIIGVDIEERKIRENIKDCKKVKFHLGDAYNVEFANSIGKLDIIIDDFRSFRYLTWHIKNRQYFICC